MNISVGSELRRLGQWRRIVERDGELQRRRSQQLQRPGGERLGHALRIIHDNGGPAYGGTPRGPLNDAQLGLARIWIAEQRHGCTCVHSTRRVFDHGSRVAERARVREDHLESVGGQFVADASQASTDGG